MTRLALPLLHASPDYGYDPLDEYLGPSRQRRRVRRAAPVTEEEQASLLEKIGHVATSGLSAVGNFLDLPGSTVRDLLAGQNPIDQYLHPFSHAQRGLSTTGRELLTMAGMRPNVESGIKGWASDPGEGLRDVAGVGAEIALDPLSLLTFGGSALGKGGQVLKKAGAPKLNALGRMRTTVREAADALKNTDALNDAAKAAGYKSGQEFLTLHGADPVGGLFGVGLPFRQPEFTLGKAAPKPSREVRGTRFDFDAPIPAATTPRTTLAERFAEGTERLGHKIRYGKIPGTEFSPGQQLARLFSPSAQGLHTPEIDPFGKRFSVTSDAVRRDVRKAIARASTEMEHAGLWNDEGSTLARNYLEGVLDPSQMDDATRAKVLQVQKIWAPFRDAIDAESAEAKRLGTPLADLDDPALIAQVPRVAIDMISRYTSKLPRESHTKGFWRGTEQLRQIISDPEIKKAERFDDALMYFYKKYGDDVVIREGDQHEIQTLVQHIREVYTPEQLAGGLYARFVGEDVQDGLIGMKFRNARTSNAIDAMASFAKPVRYLKGEKGVRLFDLIEDMGLTPGFERPTLDVVDPVGGAASAGLPGAGVSGAAGATRNLRTGPPMNVFGGVTPRSDVPENVPLTRKHIGSKDSPGVMYRIAEAMRARGTKVPHTAEGFNDLGNMQIPERLAQDIARLVQGDDIKTVVGNLMQIVDSATTLFKVGVLAMPARSVRDLVSGQAHSMLTGNWSSRSFLDAKKIVAGEVADFTDLPIVQRMLREQGLAATPENSTEIMRQLAYANELYGGQQGAFGAAEMMSPEGLKRLQKEGVPPKKAPATPVAAPTPAPTFSDRVRQQLESLGQVKQTKDGFSVKIGRKTVRVRVAGDTWRMSDLSDEGMKVAESLSEMPKFSSAPPSPTSVLSTPPPPPPVGLSDAFRRAAFVGHDPIDFTKPSTLGGGTTWNPLAIRGVGDRLTTESKWAATFERVNRGTDSLNRLTPFITNLRRGVDPGEAKRIVDAIQVNYAPHAYTNAERRYLKRLYPFYSFSSKMLKHITDELAQRPGGGVAQAIRAQHRATATELPMPSYVGQAGAIPVEELDDGTKRYITSLGLMHEDPLSFLGGSRTPLSGVGLELLSRLNPIAKLPLELTTGETFFQRGQVGGRELAEADPTLGRLLTNIGLRDEVAGRAQPVLGTGFEHILANSPVSRLLSTARTLTDPRKRAGATILPGEAFLPALTGLRITDVSPTAQDVAISQHADRVAKEKLGGRQFQTTYIPKEVVDQTRRTDPELAAQQDTFNQLKSIQQRKRRLQQKMEARKALQQATGY